MALWTATDNAAGAPKSIPAGGLGVSANGATLYGNTTVGAFHSDVALGVFGVSAAEAANTTGEGKKVVHAGWTLRKEGTGPVQSLVISNGGANNTNGFLTFTSTSGSGANASYSVNAVSGVINSVTLLDGGTGYTGVVTATGDATGGDAATITVGLGGRANRVTYETLVAQGSQNNGTSDDAILPQ